MRGSVVDSNQIAAYLEGMAGYTETLASSERLVDDGTEDLAAQTLAVYESGVWVDEWLEQKPPPKRPRNWSANSRNRFAQWTAWRQEQAGLTPTSSVQVYALHHAGVVSTFARAKVTVRAAAKLKWMVRYRYQDRMPEVAQQALAMSGTGVIDSVAAAKALAEWRRENLTPQQQRAAQRSDAARRHRAKAQAAFAELVADGNVEELQAFLDFVNAKLDEISEPADAA